MKRHTSTTLGELRLGDRFYFVSDKQRDILQVVECSNTGTQYQKMNGEKQVWVFARKGKNNRAVVFLRHTVILPGDECFLQDLNNGDQVKAGDKFMTIIKKASHEIKLKQGTTDYYTHPLTSVTLVRRSNQASA